MRRIAIVSAVILLAIIPLAAKADLYPVFGASVEFFWPVEPEMYGSRMAPNSWGEDIKGYSYSHGTDRNQFFTPSRFDRMFSPGLTQTVAWDFGLSVELAERWIWLIWAPNRDVDIVYNKTMVPVTLTPYWTFNKGGKLRPMIGAGAGCVYVNTNISGKDLYDQTVNDNYDSEGSPEPGNTGMDNVPEQRLYLRKSREFSQEDWIPEAHAVIGLELALNDRLSLTGQLRWSYMKMETIDVVRVSRGNTESWRWLEQKIKGNAGGAHGIIGLTYSF